LDGAAAHLDHLVDLEVDVGWLTRFFVSPMRDHGYDIADYWTVDARYGGDHGLDEFGTNGCARSPPKTATDRAPGRSPAGQHPGSIE